MTIIFANAQDEDCSRLPLIWRNIAFDRLIEIRPNSVNWEDEVNNALMNENDTLILVGHGTDNGLLFPNFYSGEYIIHENNIDLVHAKNVICVWCYAHEFCTKHNLNWFATSMVISNYVESLINHIVATDKEIKSANISLWNDLNYLISNNIDIMLFGNYLISHVDRSNSVDIFNRNIFQKIR